MLEKKKKERRQLKGPFGFYLFLLLIGWQSWWKGSTCSNRSIFTSPWAPASIRANVMNHVKPRSFRCRFSFVLFFFFKAWPCSLWKLLFTLYLNYIHGWINSSLLKKAARRDKNFSTLHGGIVKKRVLHCFRRQLSASHHFGIAFIRHNILQRNKMYNCINIKFFHYV